MPFKSAKQKKLFQAVAHGFKPDRVEGPTRAVAQEFVKADQKKKVKKAMGGSVAPLGMTGRRKTQRPGMPIRGVGRFATPLNVADRTLANAQNRLQTIGKRPGGVQMFAKGGLTRQHFKMLADTIKKASDAPGFKERHESITHAIADALAGTNPRFDRKRFMDAAGYDDAYFTERMKKMKGDED